MTSTLQVVDDALTTVLFDLNDPTGVNNAEWGGAMTEILATADLASPAIRSSTVLYSGADGGTTSFRRAGLTVSEFGMTMEATSYDNLAAGVNRLSTLLARGGVMKWIPQGSAETRYMDYEPSETPALVNGQELGLWEVIQLFSKPHGVMVRITRQPYLRGPELNSDSNELTNATMLLDRTVGAEVAPDDWTWGATTNISNAGVTAAREAFTFDIATTGTRNLQQTTPNSSVTGGATYTLSAYARVVSGTNGRLQMVWQGKDNAGVNQGGEVTSTNTTLTTSWQRITVSGTMNASALKAQVSWRFANSTATSVTVDIKNVCLEQAVTASGFYVGTEALDYRIANGHGRTSFFYNPGSAPAPVNLDVRWASDAAGRLTFAYLSSDGAPGNKSVTDYPYSDAYGIEAEDMTQGTNTTAVTVGALFSGAGTNASATTFAGSNTMAFTRVSDSITTDLAPLRGRAWAVMAVVGSSTISGGNFTFGFSYQAGGAAVLSGQQTLTAGIGAGVAHDPHQFILGTLFVPALCDQLDLSFHCMRNTGTDSFEWDFISLLPLDGLGLVGGDIDIGAFDGTTIGMKTLPAEPYAYAYTISTGDLTAVLIPSEGPVPFVAPPGLSVVYLGLDHGQTDEATVPTSAWTLRSKFSPRYHA